jgi:hypothetical protein
MGSEGQRVCGRAVWRCGACVLCRATHIVRNLKPVSTCNLEKRPITSAAVCNREVCMLYAMLDVMPARVSRGPVRDVDGALVRALRYDVDKSLMDFASDAGKEKVTVYRWELGGIDEITWLGLLSKFGKKPDWQPKPEHRDRAEAELRDLRAAAAARVKKKKPRA